MSEYTPTEQEILAAYVIGEHMTNPAFPVKETEACFRNWLSAHDERVRAAAQTVTSATSDGYHTFAELYDYRMLYNAHAARGWIASGIPVVKSWRHSDGELAFGGGWFIVVAELPTGQVANHYKAEHWNIFNAPEVEIPPDYDGHTPAIAAERLRESLQPVPAEQKAAGHE